DPPDAERLAFADVVDQVDAARLLGVDALGVDTEVIGIVDLRLIDVAQRAIGADDLADVALEHFLIEHLAFAEIEFLPQLAFGEVVIAAERDRSHLVAGAFVDQEIDLHFALIRRPDDLPADAGVEKAFGLVIAAQGGNIIFDLIRVVRARAEHPDPG